MNANRLVRFIVVGMVLLLAIPIGAYFLLRPSGKTGSDSQNETDINAIYQVVGEFGARLEDVDLSTPRQNILTALYFNLKRLITDRLYQEFAQDTSKIPGRNASSPWPEQIAIVSLQKLDGKSYTVNGKIILMTSVEMARVGNAGETPVTLTLKNVNGTWLIDDVR
jgi:hypothetical protein